MRHCLDPLQQQLDQNNEYAIILEKKHITDTFLSFSNISTWYQIFNVTIFWFLKSVMNL